MVVFQRNIQGLRYGIQLKPVQAGKKLSCDSDGIQNSRFKFQSLQGSLPGNKADIKGGVVGNQGAVLTELQKLRKDYFDSGRRKHHVVIDTGQLLDFKGNGDIRIYKGAEFVCNLSVDNLDSADFNNLVFFRAESGCLNIKDHIRIGKALPSGMLDQILHIIDQIPLHAVKYLKGIPLVQSMAGIREGLDTAMIGNGNGRHSPGFGSFNNILDFRNSVHIAHFRMAVKLYPLDRAVVCPFAGKIIIFFYAPDRTDGQFSVKPVDGGHSLETDKGFFFDCVV